MESIILGFCKCKRCGTERFVWNSYFICRNCGSKEYEKSGDVDPEGIWKETEEGSY